MKKVYSGSGLAAAILDDREEIDVVIAALIEYVAKHGLGLNSTAAELVGELTLPAPRI